MKVSSQSHKLVPALSKKVGGEFDSLRHIGRETYGTFGCGELQQDNCMVIESKDLISLRMAIASTRVSCFWIHMQEQLLG